MARATAPPRPCGLAWRPSARAEGDDRGRQWAAFLAQNLGVVQPLDLEVVSLGHIQDDHPRGLREAGGRLVRKAAAQRLIAGLGEIFECRHGGGERSGVFESGRVLAFVERPPCGGN